MKRNNMGEHTLNPKHYFARPKSMNLQNNNKKGKCYMTKRARSNQ